MTEIRSLEQSIERTTRDPRTRLSQYSELKSAMDRLATTALTESDKMEYIDKVSLALQTALQKLQKLQEQFKMYSPAFIDPNGQVDPTIHHFVERELETTYIDRYKVFENDLLVYKSELCKRIAAAAIAEEEKRIVAAEALAAQKKLTDESATPEYNDLVHNSPSSGLTCKHFLYRLFNKA